MNREKIEAIIDDLKQSEFHVEYTGGQGYIDLFNGNEHIQDGIKIEFVEHIYTEGDGAYQAVVYKITDIESGDVKHIKFEGVSNSWCSDEWEGTFVFCEPKEVVVIQYESIEDTE